MLLFFRIVSRPLHRNLLSMLFFSVAMSLLIVVGAVFQGVFLGTFPVPGADSTLLVWQGSERMPSARQSLSDLNLRDIEDELGPGWLGGDFEFNSERFHAASGWRSIDVVRMSPRLLAMLGLGVQIGRQPTEEDEDRSDAPAALLADEFWRREFQADRSVLGAGITVGDARCQVVGVASPKASRFFELFDRRPAVLMVQTRSGRSSRRDYQHLQAILKPRDKRSASGLAGRLPALARRLREADANANAGLTLDVESLRSYVLAPWKTPLYSTAGAVFLVLVSCALSAGTLQVCRTLSRLREHGIRMASGANPTRLACEVVGENLLTVLLALAIGLAAARASLPWVTTHLRDLGLPLQFTPAMGWGSATAAALVLAFGLAVVLTSLATALLLIRLNPVDALRGTVSSSTHTQVQSLQKWLIGAQVGLSVLLLTASVMLFRQVREWQQQTLGSEYERVIAVRLYYRMDLDALGINSEAAFHGHLRAFLLPTLQEVERRTPDGRIGVLSAPPLAFQRNPVLFSGAGAGLRPGVAAEAQSFPILPSYFPFLGLKVVQGRACAPEDSGQKPERVVVNQAFLHRYGSGDPVLGRLLTTGKRPHLFTYQIIGVVSDRPDGSHDLVDTPPIVYRCTLAHFLTVLLRARSAQTAAAEAAVIARDLARAHPELEVEGSVVEDEAMAAIRKPAVQGGFFAVVSGILVVLSALGLYALSSGLIAFHRRDLAMRRCLGARTRHVLLWCFGRVGPAVAGGFALGLLAAMTIGRELSPGLGHQPDLRTMVGVLLPLLVTWGPALVKPAITALRIKAKEAANSPGF